LAALLFLGQGFITCGLGLNLLVQFKSIQVFELIDVKNRIIVIQRFVEYI